MHAARWGSSTLLVAILAVGCSKPTEAERLAKFRGSLKYKAYRLAMESATKLVVTEYNKTAATPVSEELAHGALGLVWFAAQRSDLSLVEADLLAGCGGDKARLLALGLQSVALYRMKYPDLSKSHYENLKLRLAALQDADTGRVEAEHKLVLVALIATGLTHGDPEMAKYGADALGAISQLDYLPPLVGAVIEAQKGNPLRAAEQLRLLNQSEQFSAHKRALFAEVSAILATAPDQKQLAEALLNQVLVSLVKRVVDDIFTAENKAALLEKVRGVTVRVPDAESPGERTGK